MAMLSAQNDRTNAAALDKVDDTLIRAYAQPEEAWRRLLGTFAEPLDAAAATVAAVDPCRGSRRAREPSTARDARAITRCAGRLYGAR